MHRSVYKEVLILDAHSVKPVQSRGSHFT